MSAPTEQDSRLSLAQLRRRLQNLNEYLITDKSVKGVREQARDVKPFGFQKRGGIQFNEVTQEYFQWWDKKEIK